MKLSGHTALITGSSRGIGRAIALAFASEGCNIILNYAHNQEAADAVEKLLLGKDVEVLKVKCDISDKEQVKEMIKQSIERFDRIDILVNNAGIARPSLLKKMSDEDWHRVLDTNLGGVYNCCSSLVEHMIESGGGKIINMASVYGQTGAFGQCNYAAAKWGIIGFTKSLALELGKHDITVNAIAPGAIETDMTKGIEKFLEKYLDNTPISRLGKPEEVAAIALFIATEATYTTGEVIAVNGGFHT